MRFDEKERAKADIVLMDSYIRPLPERMTNVFN